MREYGIFHCGQYELPRAAPRYPFLSADSRGRPPGGRGRYLYPRPRWGARCWGARGDVGLVLAIESERLVSIGSLGHDLHFGNGGEQRDEALADDMVIVDHEQTHGFSGSGGRWDQRQHSQASSWYIDAQRNARTLRRLRVDAENP